MQKSMKNSMEFFLSNSTLMLRLNINLFLKLQSFNELTISQKAIRSEVNMVKLQINRILYYNGVAKLFTSDGNRTNNSAFLNLN